MAGTECVVYLDDDNVFHPTHLCSLTDLLRAEPTAQAAHSWRRLLTHDGGGNRSLAAGTTPGAAIPPNVPGPTST
jgi:hypothetical protein